MAPIILFRQQFDSDGELDVARAHLPVVSLRSQVPPASLVVGRYACLPYYQELEADLAHYGSRLVNSFAEHRYIANFEYYEDIADYTFPTWFAGSDVPLNKRDQPLVVKGRTNSRKLQWKTHMFAADFRAAMHLCAELMNDPFIGPQGVVLREYIPLETFEVGLNDVPMTNEWRLFFYGEQLLAHGYYWAMIDSLSHVEAATPDFLATGVPFAQKVARILAKRTHFFVLDIAKTQDGRWQVVEVNDGQQSGLNSFVDPGVLYAALAQVLTSGEGPSRATSG